MAPTTQTPLFALAEAAGVLTSYEDVFHTTHPASEAALRGVLTALHFDVSSDESTQAALTTLRTRELEGVLEPFYAISAGDDFSIAFVLPREHEPESVRWSLTGEDGARYDGEIDVAQTKFVETVHARDRAFERRRAVLREALPEGYYDVEFGVHGVTHRARAVVAPQSCYIPEAMERRGIWGLAVQVYALRSRRRAYAGDFTDLQTLCATVREAGGGAVGVNPLHLLPRGSESPYGPSSRAYLNWIYLDLSALPGYAKEDVPEIPVSGDEEPFVDYAALYDRTWSVARAAFDHFSESATDRRADFDAYVEAGGERLRRAALFQALADRFRSGFGGDDWRTWPHECQDPATAVGSDFAREAENEIAFYLYLQWQCDEQLQRAADACGAMPVGIYRDIAVGTQLGGCDTWLGDGALTHEVGVGAPPDALNRAGQDWGVAPFDPIALREAGYRPFAELIRANARHAGALRIDHVMGLLRLWWVPAGAKASDGAYVSYRLDEMLAVLALESRRARCLIVGEDLGTVPPGFRDRLDAADVLSYRILQFEHDDTHFLAPEEYPQNALVAVGTHDLPPMAAFWNGHDIETRVRIGAVSEDDASSDRTDRALKRAQLETAFAAAGIAAGQHVRIEDTAHGYLAKTPARMLLVSMEDVLGEAEQINMPATTNEYPNWRHRNSLPVEALGDDERFVTLANALRGRRGSDAATS